MLVQGQAGTVEKTGAQRMTGLSQAAFEEGGRGSWGWRGGGVDVWDEHKQTHMRVRWVGVALRPLIRGRMSRAAALS